MIRRFVIGLLLALVLPAAAAGAEDDALVARYNAEQATVAQLRKSPAASDKRALAEMLLAGLIAGPDNPLRKPDRVGATEAYRAALAAGDRSDNTTVAFARLLVRQGDGEFAKLAPLLRTFMFQGNGEAAYVLALAAGQGRLEGGDEAHSLLESAAVMGSVSAIVDLADSGAATGQVSASVVLEELQAKASEGSERAMFALYRLYRQGALVGADPKVALDWLQKAVQLGYQPAMAQLAEHLLYGIDMPADPARAVEILRTAANAGSVAAALTLGRNIVSLGPLPVSIEERRLWLSRASALDNRSAAIELYTLDLSLAIAFKGDTAERQARIEKALAPIATDPEALADLADRTQKSVDAATIGPVLLPLLHNSVLAGSITAGLAYDAWLHADGKPLPADVSHALVSNLRKSPPEGAGFAAFTLASLALDGRIPEADVKQADAIQLLFKAADAGVGEAMLRIAGLYARGEVFPRNPQFAERWYQKAAGQNVERAYWDLAALHIRSDHPEERAEGERFYLQQMDNGDVRGAMALITYGLRTGKLDATTLARAKDMALEPREVVALAKILAGTGAKRDSDEAKRLLAPLMTSDASSDALILYGLLLVRDDVTSEEGKKGVEILRHAVADGSDDAKLALSATLLSSGVFEDKQGEAIELLNEVIAGNPRSVAARLLLSDAYLRGRGVKSDPAKAAALVAQIRAEGEYAQPKATMLEADWLSFSQTRRDPESAVAMLEAQADHGSAAARGALGVTYLTGFGPRQDPDLAAGYLYDAAGEGDKDAMAALGHLLMNGQGVNQSQDAGLKWLTRAADAGSIDAIYDLSRIYALGSMGKIDGLQSVGWLRRAAEHNNPNAAYQLGLAYLRGEWVEQNEQEAAKWFERAANAGNLLAGRTLKTIKGDRTDGVENDANPADPEGRRAASVATGDLK